MISTMVVMVKNFLFKSKKRVAVLLCAALLCVALWLAYGAYDYYFVTGLASDEEMIAQFYEHKAELEMVVKQFRTFGRYDEKLLRSANVSEFCAINDGGISSGLRWIPDSYPMEQYELANAKELGSYWDGSWSYKLRPEESWELRYEYGAIRIQILPREKYFRRTFRYSYIEKGLFHVPDITVTPWDEHYASGGFFYLKLSDGSRNHFMNESRNNFMNYVLLSLNRIPDSWSREADGCVFREIETHWYIQMCAVKRWSIFNLTLDALSSM